MSVDFFPCDACDRSICDCGHYARCNDDCGRRWCDDKCAAADGHKNDDEDYQDGSCNYCRNEEANDEDLFKFLLKKHDLKREDVLAEYLKELK